MPLKEGFGDAFEIADPASPNSIRNDGPAWSEGRMYAIAFDFNTAACQSRYPGADWKSAYRDVQRVLEAYGFWSQQGSVYYSKHATAVKVIQAVLAVQAKHPWFREVVRDLRMLRIEENDDLLPLLGQPELPLPPATPKQPPSEFKLN
jgi:virulence-associated protein VapD